MELNEARELKNQLVAELDEPTTANPDPEPRIIFEDLAIYTAGGLGFHLPQAEQDAAGWWFEHDGRPTFVPHHAVDCIRFTHEDTE